MAFKYKDRVKTTTLTSGTGAFSLEAATGAYVNFSDKFSNGDMVPYCCASSTQFEVGIGTYVSSSDTITRGLVLSNSNLNQSLVNFNSGQKTIFVTAPSEITPILKELPGTANKVIIYDGDEFVMSDVPISTNSSNTQVLYNNNNVITGNANFYFDQSTNILHVVGAIEASAKSFVIDHPTIKNSKLYHGCLEGPEHGIYLRGSIKSKKTFFFELPEYFVALTNGNYTIHITTINCSIKILNKTKNGFTLKPKLFSKINCDYLIIGEREPIEIVKKCF